MHDPLGIQALHGPDRLAVVAELPVVVVLQNEPATRACPVHDSGPPGGRQRPTGGELVYGREQLGPLPAQPVHPGTVLVEWQRNRPYGGLRQQLTMETQTVRLHGQRPPQHPAVEQQPQRVRET